METGVIWVSICRRRQSLLSYEAAIATAPWELTVCSVDAKSGQTTCPVTCVCKVWLCRVSMVTGSSVTERKPSKTSKKVSDSNSSVLFPGRFTTKVLFSLQVGFASSLPRIWPPGVWMCTTLHTSSTMTFLEISRSTSTEWAAQVERGKRFCCNVFWTSRTNG